jgi:phosphatidylinositol-bisphosphatase
MADLQPFLMELKRLAQVAQDAKFHKGGTTHRWIQYYPVFQLEKVPIMDLHKSTRDKNPLMSYSNVIKDSVPGENTLSEELQQVKEEWAAKEMLAREAQYSTFEAITIFIGTWNVNEQPPTENLSSWLSSFSDPDMYILGFQEVTSPSEGLLNTDNKREQEWCDQIEKTLNSLQDEYSKVITKQLVGMLVIFYAKNSIVESIKETSVNAIGVGVMGIVTFIC